MTLTLIRSFTDPYPCPAGGSPTSRQDGSVHAASSASRAPDATDMTATDAALATLAAAAPGAEATALQALNDALDPPGLAALLRHAGTALHQFAVRPTAHPRSAPACVA